MSKLDEIVMRATALNPKVIDDVMFISLDNFNWLIAYARKLETVLNEIAHEGCCDCADNSYAARATARRALQGEHQ
jgi:hypothetical protein